MSIDWAKQAVGAALRKLGESDGRHLHHSACIHNLPPEEQIRLYGWTTERWMRVMGHMPEQITPDQWETTPPDLPPRPATTSHGAPERRETDEETA